MKLNFSRQEQMDLMTLAEGTGDGLLRRTAESGSADTKTEISAVRDACAGALETGAHRRHGLDTLEELYERASEKLYGPDSAFDMS